jgi:hypothetical protein
MAIYSDHVYQIEKITALKERLTLTKADSLYLRL